MMLVDVALLGLAAVLGIPQDPPCVLEGVDEREGSIEASFSCPWPKGAVVRLEIQRRTTHVSWAPWVEKRPDGKTQERVNLSVQERGRTVHRDLIRLEKAGAFSVSWKPKVAAVYHFVIVYDPAIQDARDARFTGEMRTVHRVISLRPGQAREFLADEGKEVIGHAAAFFDTLRTAILNSKDAEELEERMRKHVDESARRGVRSQHPGSYSVMEILSPYVQAGASDPSKPAVEDKLLPFFLDEKSACVPLGVVRESMVLALMLLEDALAEAAHLAPMDATRGGFRRAAAAMVGEELPGAVKELRKLEPAASLAGLWRRTKFDDLVTRGSECIKRMLDKGKVETEVVKELLAELKSAAATIGHPLDSLKE